MSVVHRNHEARTDVKSYVVHEVKGVFTVKGSHFVIGYTKAHCETPELAVRYAMISRRKQAEQLVKDLGVLGHLMERALLGEFVETPKG